PQTARGTSPQHRRKWRWTLLLHPPFPAATTSLAVLGKTLILATDNGRDSTSACEILRPLRFGRPEHAAIPVSVPGGEDRARVHEVHHPRQHDRPRGRRRDRFAVQQ